MAAHNLAAEEVLLSQGGAALFLWRNERTVVIGKNQNARAECRITELSRDGGFLARRGTGGGAVYHDKSNLNFSFIAPFAEYDVPRQLSVILSALRRFGIDAHTSGRNDLLANGAKFSGSAYKRGAIGLHHGTLLIDTDMDALARYLSPTARKLEAKGVKSVRSRVINLRELCPDIDCERLTAAIERAYFEIYGEYERRDISQLPQEALRAAQKKHLSREWRFPTEVPYTKRIAGRTDEGEFELLFRLENGLVADCVCYSDALDEALPLRIRDAVLGAKYKSDAIIAAAPTLAPIITESGLPK